MSTSTNMGSGRIDVSIPELRRMKASAESLIREIESRTPTVLSQARSVANGALREYSAAVIPAVNTVLAQCNTLSTNNTSVLNELRELVRGLDRVITGYQTLERDLANASGGITL